MSSNQQFRGGFPIDYTKLRARYFPQASPNLHDYLMNWILKRRNIIQDICDHGSRMPSGRLDSCSLDMVSRWAVTSIGNSPTAWMERSITATAMLQDYRSRRFGRRVHSTNMNMEAFALEYMQDESFLNEMGQSCFSRMEHEVALQTLVFAREWLRYLDTLLIHTPGRSIVLKDEDLVIGVIPPDCVTWLIGNLAHCRPCGAFLELHSRDTWSKWGGRQTCRMPLLCPHCHARNATRLVQRVLEGPWAANRRQGRRLALIRLTISTEDLQLNPEEVDMDRVSLSFFEWLRRSTENFHADPGDETMTRNIACNQSIECSLTRVEIRAARERLRSCGQGSGSLSSLG